MTANRTYVWVTVFLLSFLLLGVSAQSHARVQQYELLSSEEGMKNLDMGPHDFCALSAVGSGGFNSYCAILRDRNRWILQAMDPRQGARGESQRCAAMCLDFDDRTAGGRAEREAYSTVNLAGKWRSSSWDRYTIQQSGNTFTWQLKGSLRETGRGTLSGRTVDVRWEGQRGRGNASGRVAAVDRQNRATRIDWSHGVSFFRE